jgi:S1-C subfamily serine protease
MKSRDEIGAIAEALGGMPVWGVLADSPAARVGLRYGDVVLEVNGVKTPSASDFVAARELRTDGAVVTFQRDGELRTVELKFDLEQKRPELEDVVKQIVNERVMPSSRPARSNDEPS